MKETGVSAVLAATLSYLVSQLLVPAVFQQVIQQRLAHSVGFVLIVAVLFFFFRWRERIARRHARADLGLAEPGFRPHRGLIALASPGQRRTPAENAVAAHHSRLEHCWLIAGPGRPDQRPSARENAQSIAEKYRTIDGRPVHFHLVQIDDEHSPKQVYHVVRSIYEQARAYGLKEQDIVADYTGGTKSMSVGMALACSTAEDRDVEYMKPRELMPTGVAAPESEAEPLLVDLRFGEEA